MDKSGLEEKCHVQRKLIQYKLTFNLLIMWVTKKDQMHDYERKEKKYVHSVECLSQSGYSVTTSCTLIENMEI